MGLLNLGKAPGAIQWYPTVQTRRLVSGLVYRRAGPFLRTDQVQCHCRICGFIRDWGFVATDRALKCVIHLAQGKRRSVHLPFCINARICAHN